MCLLRVFLRLSGSPKWLFTVSEVKQGFKHDFVHKTPLWRDYVCARSVPLLTPLLSTRESLLSYQHPPAHSIHSAPSRDTIIGLKDSTNWLVNIHGNQNIIFHLNLRVTLISFLKSALMFASLKIKECSGCSSFSGLLI